MEQNDCVGHKRKSATDKLRRAATREAKSINTSRLVALGSEEINVFFFHKVSGALL